MANKKSCVVVIPKAYKREGERERGGRCGGEEPERDLLFSLVKRVCCIEYRL
jgi:hypothetical protein